MRKIKNQIEEQVPKPFKRSRSMIRISSESNLLSGDRIYDLKRKKDENLKKIEHEMLNVLLN
jgi:hypothetical protein